MANLSGRKNETSKTFRFRQFLIIVSKFVGDIVFLFHYATVSIVKKIIEVDEFVTILLIFTKNRKKLSCVLREKKDNSVVEPVQNPLFVERH